ncbi:MAG: hypothetical protein Q8N61_00040 [bacterium]|nr:hypothetical protein [bacterium]
MSQDFPDLFTVQAPALPAAPAAPAAPAPALPAAPKGLLPDELNILAPSASPSVLNPGQTVTFTIPFTNTGPISPPIQADVYVVDSAGNGVASLPRQSFSPAIGLQTVRQLQWTVPPTAAPGSYGLQVFAWDPNTFVAGDSSTYLVRESAPNLFTVQALPAPAAPAALTPTALQVGQLTLETPTASPLIALPGQTVSITLPFTNSGLASPTILTAMFVEHHELSTVGRGVRYPLPQLSLQPTPEAVTSRSVTWVVPADAPVGYYDVGVLAWDPANPNVALVVQRFNQVFQVGAPPTPTRGLLYE